MSGAEDTVNPLAMSDEDFLKDAVAPPPVEEEQVEEPDEDEEEVDEAEGEQPDASETSDDDPEDGDDEASGEEDSGNEEDPEETEETSDTEAEEEDSSEAEPDPVEDETEEGETDSDSIDYEASYKKIMAPFKANGKMIEPRDPEEAIKLMQMGANYTRKMQDIQPYRKVLLMLQNNELLDEGKLSYLIDLDKKDPAAISKLIKDSGIDPLEIDPEAANAYKAGNHRVTDAEATLAETLQDIGSTDEGKETLRTVEKTWDDVSKEALWESPQILTLINEQRSTGVYDAIVAEMDRQKTLGAISPSTPFLEAYRIVGDELSKRANGSKNHTQQDSKPSEAQPSKQPVDRRAAVPKSKVKNGDKAKAAATTRGKAAKRKEQVNPLAMSDDEFLKQMENRV